VAVLGVALVTKQANLHVFGQAGGRFQIGLSLLRFHMSVEDTPELCESTLPSRNPAFLRITEADEVMVSYAPCLKCFTQLRLRKSGSARCWHMPNVQD